MCRGDLLLEHLEALYNLYGQRHGVRIARKHIAWYSKVLLNLRLRGW